MILWLKDGGGAGSGLLLMTILFLHGHAAIVVAAGVVNAAWVLDGRLPAWIRPSVHLLFLAVNTWLSAYAVLTGAPLGWILFVVAGSLLSWNAGLFLKRWPDAPTGVQRRYARHLAAVLALGLGMALTALSLQGRISLCFPLALALMLLGGVLLLRMLLLVSRKGLAEVKSPIGGRGLS